MIMNPEKEKEIGEVILKAKAGLLNDFIRSFEIEEIFENSHNIIKYKNFFFKMDLEIPICIPKEVFDSAIILMFGKYFNELIKWN